MNLRSKTVVVKDLPARPDRRTETALLDELQMAMKVDRPAIVLNCSHVRGWTLPQFTCCFVAWKKR